VYINVILKTKLSVWYHTEVYHEK